MWLDRLFFALLIFFLPVQLSFHFFSDSNIIQGQIVDYLIPQVYLTDLLLVMTLLLWIYRLRKTVRDSGFLLKLRRVGRYILLLNIILLLHTYFFSNAHVYSYLYLLRLNLLAGMVIYIVFEKIATLFIAKLVWYSTVYVGILSLLQFYYQRSVGGMWYLLGERTFSLYTAGISKVSVFGNLVLRPYATFPHPNVLGAYLAVTMSLALVLVTSVKKERKPVYFLLVILNSTVLVFSQSRVALVTFFAGILVAVVALAREKLIKKSWRNLYLGVLITLFVILGRYIWVGVSRSVDLSDASLQQRLELTRSALAIINEHLLFGVGLGNFLPVLADYSNMALRYADFQPVHNVFLLVASESGIVGLGVFIAFAIYVYRRVLRKPATEKLVLMIIFWQIATLFLFDHYFYTLWQAQLLLSIILGIMLRNDGKSDTEDRHDVAARSRWSLH